MPDLMTLTGIVATSPRHITTNSGLDITSFRLASGQRRYDKDQRKWVETETNWYTVTTFRQLALNLAGSIERGQHVLVSGRLRIRSWENGEKSGTTIELEADAVGHDLSWGTSAYSKTVGTSGGGSASEESWAAPGAASAVGALGADDRTTDAHDDHARNRDTGSSTESTGSGDPQLSLLPF